MLGWENLPKKNKRVDDVIWSRVLGPMQRNLGNVCDPGRPVTCLYDPDGTRMRSTDLISLVPRLVFQPLSDTVDIFPGLR